MMMMSGVGIEGECRSTYMFQRRNKVFFWKPNTKYASMPLTLCSTAGETCIDVYIKVTS